MKGRLERAKLYYFLAMREVLLQEGDDFRDSSEVHQSIIQEHLDLAGRPSVLAKSEVLFKICLDDFIGAGWVESIGDEFAPLYVRKSASLTDGPMLDATFQQLYDKFEQLGDAQYEWLSSALTAAVDSFKLEQLNTSLADRSLGSEPRQGEDSNSFASAVDDGWSPIPLERDDPKQASALRALERAIEEIRGGNGYAATAPEEKAFVQDKLLAVTKRLKEDSQISWMYLSEFAFKPLGIIIKRFGGAAVGVAAVAAKEALVSWLKSKGISFLDDLPR
jgi:hypothetical protein